MIPDAPWQPTRPRRAWLAGGGLCLLQFQRELQDDARYLRLLDADPEAGPEAAFVAAGRQYMFTPISRPEAGSWAWRSGAADLRAARCRWRIIWRGWRWPTCSSTACPTMPTPPPATPCGRVAPAYLPGHTFAGRVAASLLQAVGLPELVTENLEDYETLALRLARDPALLKSSRARLAQNRATAPFSIPPAHPPYRGGL